MAILLNIDTAVETASVCVSNDSDVIAVAVNENQKDHAAWLHIAIRKILQQAGLSVNDLEGIAVSIGPGSYTGLRIGLSAAKGLCYALSIPLISIDTLKIMAHAVNKEAAELFCPVIDARRMEVFTAVYDKFLNEIIKPRALVIDKNSFSELLTSHKIVFCGTGNKKLQDILFHDNAVFSTTKTTAADMPDLAFELFREKKFASMAYVEPLYLKEFYTPPVKNG
jgi:tRNA threonylcarbamoyladenosine biosynthesis protein TsaB